MANQKRCRWCNENNPLYVAYHDEEWGRPNFDERYLFEMLVLESFQAGLSWECVLNKRRHFRAAFDGFDVEAVSGYDGGKVDVLMENKGIIRNRRKICAAIENAKIFKKITGEYGSFHDYLRTFTHDQTLYETGRTTNALSDAISADLKRRGMTFVGSVIVYSYLQAIGVIDSHEEGCCLYRGGEGV